MGGGVGGFIATVAWRGAERYATRSASRSALPRRGWRETLMKSGGPRPASGRLLTSPGSGPVRPTDFQRCLVLLSLQILQKQPIMTHFENPRIYEQLWAVRCHFHPPRQSIGCGIPHIGFRSISKSMHTQRAPLVVYGVIKG